MSNSVIFEYSLLGSGVRLVDKLVFGRYCVDKTGTAIDVQAAALDWLITDSRQTPSSHHPVKGKVPRPADPPFGIVDFLNTEQV